MNDRRPHLNDYGVLPPSLSVAVHNNCKHFGLQRARIRLGHKTEDRDRQHMYNMTVSPKYLWTYQTTEFNELHLLQQYWIYWIIKCDLLWVFMGF